MNYKLYNCRHKKVFLVYFQSWGFFNFIADNAQSLTLFYFSITDYSNTMLNEILERISRESTIQKKNM